MKIIKCLLLLSLLIVTSCSKNNKDVKTLEGKKTGIFTSEPDTVIYGP